MPEETLNPIDDGLDKIEVGIRQLKVQYEMFFSGHLPRQPFEARKDIERIIDTLRRTPFQRFADRFRFNTLTSKYQTMCELWGKMLRAREEGRLRPGLPAPGGLRRTGFNPPASSAAAAAGQDGPPPDSFILADPRKEERLCRMFYDRFLQASKETSSGGRTIPFEKFRAQIEEKTATVRRKAGCEAVTYDIEVRADKVVVKARPISGGENRGSKS